MRSVSLLVPFVLLLVFRLPRQAVLLGLRLPPASVRLLLCVLFAFVARLGMVFCLFSNLTRVALVLLSLPLVLAGFLLSLRLCR